MPPTYEPVSPDFGGRPKSTPISLEHRVTVAEQRLTTLTEWRAGVDRRLEVIETGRIAAGGE